jgi:phosphoesterase RecJ-like protein
MRTEAAASGRYSQTMTRASQNTNPARPGDPSTALGIDDARALETIATTLKAHSGPIVLASHVNPDGDALGSTLALKRALQALGKETTLPLTPPRYLAFLAEPGELSEPLTALPEDALVVVLDVEVSPRLTGVPVEGQTVSGSSLSVVIDHHGTNNGAGDLVWVNPQRAATAHMVKDLIETLGVPWTTDLATPCLTGLITDTGNFRFGNTTPEVLRAAADLVGHGVALAELTDKLQLRHPDYFRMLGKVMSTVEFPFEGQVAYAEVTKRMREEVGPTDDDSDDYVGLIRYAEGVQVALFLREDDPEEGTPKTKVSVRSRGNVSAQAICVQLGGGGHVPAAGATVRANLAKSKTLVLEATKAELERAGFTV